MFFVEINTWIEKQKDDDTHMVVGGSILNANEGRCASPSYTSSVLDRTNKDLRIALIYH